MAELDQAQAQGKEEPDREQAIDEDVIPEEGVEQVDDGGRIRPVDLLAAPEFVGKEASCVTVLNALIPVFGLILLGWFRGARRILRSDGGATLSIITFKLMMPVLLFSGLARADLSRAM